jgi:predicted nucleic acid-binding protein
VLCPDTSFLLDYLDEDRPAAADAKAYLDARQEREYRIPSVAFFEVLRGGARLRGPAGVADLVEQLGWADHLPLTPAASREAALVDGELVDAGEEINLGDVLIAGTVREAGGTVLTHDDHFERVENLDVETY